MSDQKKFILFGVGFVAERHLKVIKSLGHELIGALDTHDSVGILDRYFPNCEFFTEPERFDRWLYGLHRKCKGPDWASVCSPNWLHDSHCRMAMRAGADVICEKPVVINPRNVLALQDAEDDYGKRICVVHQLRNHPDLLGLKAHEETKVHRWENPPQVDLTYCAPRGPWYERSWKGDEKRSGGIIMNLGIHFLDALCWIFGDVRTVKVHYAKNGRLSGFFDMDRAQVRWFLSTNPADCIDGKPDRSMIVDGRPAFNFNEKFSNLHRAVYEAALYGDGNPVYLDDALPALEVAQRVRDARVCLPHADDLDEQHDKLAEIIG